MALAIQDKYNISPFLVQKPLKDRNSQKWDIKDHYIYSKKFGWEWTVVDILWSSFSGSSTLVWFKTGSHHQQWEIIPVKEQETFALVKPFPNPTKIGAADGKSEKIEKNHDEKFRPELAAAYFMWVAYIERPNGVVGETFSENDPGMYTQIVFFVLNIQ